MRTYHNSEELLTERNYARGMNSACPESKDCPETPSVTLVGLEPRREKVKVHYTKGQG